MGYGKLWMKFVCTAVLACAGLTAIAAAPVVAGERTAQHTGTGLLDVVLDLADEALPPLLYMVIDLSGGTNATSYPVTYLDAVPVGGWTDEYKATKLVMRKVPAGVFTMGSPTNEIARYTNEVQHAVTLSQDFYIGVFEVTQRQWERVVGTWPSYFNNASYRDTRPVEQVTYNDIRGSSAGVGWPGTGAVDTPSFMGKMRARTGKVFDLPTEAQWEYACRAGTMTALNSGKNLTSADYDVNVGEVGRYYHNGGGSVTPRNATTGVGSAKSGSFLPNAWGLYDMHGNVWEWCLDWYGTYLGAVSDPKGAASGSDRMIRSGGWYNRADSCRSANRSNVSPDNRNLTLGFRAVLPVTGVCRLTIVGGTGGGDYLAGAVANVVAEVPPVGHAFARWTVSPEGADLGASFVATQASTSVTMPDLDVTLTAVFESNTYTVMFDAQGGVVSPDSKSITYGTLYGELPEPTRVGYTFGGWWMGANGAGDEITARSSVSIAADHTLYAKWTINHYDLVYVAGTNGLIEGESKQSVNYGAAGSSVTAVPDPGCRFLGWSDGYAGHKRRDVNVTNDISVTAQFGGVAFANGNEVAAESAGAITLTVNGGTPTGMSSVGVYLQQGTATASDYTVPPAAQLTLTWAAGEVGPKTVTIPIKQDSLVEDAETFYVMLGSPKNCLIDEPSICQVTITDANRGDTLADALDNVLLMWTTGGIPMWVSQNAVTSDGEDAAASGLMASNKVSYVQTTVMDTGTLSFVWSVVGKGVLRLVDGTKVLAVITNDTAWEARTLALTRDEIRKSGIQNAIHTLKWEFMQGGDASGRAYLDQVVWLPGGKEGVAVTASASNPAGGTVTGTGVYYSGAKVQLNARPRPGWLFTGWTPANLFANPLTAVQTLAISNSPVSVTAGFAKIPVVTGLPRPAEGGTVTGSGPCLSGKSVTLKATAVKDWCFINWSDGVQAATRAVTTAEDVTFFAQFKLVSQIAPPLITNPGAQNAMVGVMFLLPLLVESECLPTVTVTGLPSGLKYDAVRGTVSGVLSAVPAGGAATVKIAASNTGGRAADAVFQITGEPLTASAQGTFSGIARKAGEEADTVVGLFTMTVSPLGKISAKVTAQAGSCSFAVASWDSVSNDVFSVMMQTIKGETLTLVRDTGAALSTLNLQGVLTGGMFGTDLFSVQGQRNEFLDKKEPDYAMATNVLVRYKGYYTVALYPDAVCEAGAAGNAPQGSGYLTLTVKDGGVVSVSGKLADGTALSGSSTLLVLESGKDGACAYVPLLFPLYNARGMFAGLMELDPAVDVSPMDNVAVPAEGFLPFWRYPGKAPMTDPAQTEDRFALALGMSGGYYSPLIDLRAYYANMWFKAQVPNVSYTYSSGAYTTTVDVVQSALPEVPMTFVSGTDVITLPLGAVPVFDAVMGTFVYALTNPALTTLSLNKAIGLFSGKFNLYYEYRDQMRSCMLKTVSVAHEGVLSPVRSSVAEPFGQGFYLVPDSWKSQDEKPVTYPIKHSYGVEFWKEGEQ